MEAEQESLVSRRLRHTNPAAAIIHTQQDRRKGTSQAIPYLDSSTALTHIECKCYKRPVASEIIRSVYGVVETN